MKGLGLSFIVVALTLGLAEAGVRVIDWFRPPEPPRNEGRDIFVADSAIGYHLWPSTRTRMRYPPGQHRVFHLVSNSDGFFSSRELGEPDPRPRILVLAFYTDDFRRLVPRYAGVGFPLPSSSWPAAGWSPSRSRG